MATMCRIVNAHASRVADARASSKSIATLGFYLPFCKAAPSKLRQKYSEVCDQSLIDAMPDSNPQLTSDRLRRGRDKGRTAARIGIVLILLSGVLWFSLFAIPFLPLTVGQKAALAGAVFVGVQIAWWSGAALVGPQTVARLWSWCGRRKKELGQTSPDDSDRAAQNEMMSRCDETPRS